MKNTLKIATLIWLASCSSPLNDDYDKKSPIKDHNKELHALLSSHFSPTINTVIFQDLVISDKNNISTSKISAHRVWDTITLTMQDFEKSWNEIHQTIVSWVFMPDWNIEWSIDKEWVSQSTYEIFESACIQIYDTMSLASWWKQKWDTIVYLTHLPRWE